LDQVAFQFCAILPVRLHIASPSRVLELVAAREDATALHRDARADSNVYLVLMLAAVLVSVLVSVVRQSLTLRQKSVLELFVGNQRRTNWFVSISNSNPNQ
jgi:hypothetical protein